MSEEEFFKWARINRLNVIEFGGVFRQPLYAPTRHDVGFDDLASCCKPVRVDAFMAARRRAAVLHAAERPMLAGAAGAALVIAAVYVTLPKFSYREIEVPLAGERQICRMARVCCRSQDRSRAGTSRPRQHLPRASRSDLG
jgi:hypothetical protein